MSLISFFKNPRTKFSLNQSYSRLSHHVMPKLGAILRLTHDRTEGETKKEYLERCFLTVKEVVDENPDKIVFFCCSTMIARNILPSEQHSRMVHSVLSAVGDRKPFNTEQYSGFSPGHIAGYWGATTSSPEGIISHLPEQKKKGKQDNSMLGGLLLDVETSIKENQLRSTWVVTLPKNCFSVDICALSAAVSGGKYPYGLGGSRGGIDCCGAISLLMGSNTSKIQEPTPDPVMMMREIIHYAATQLQMSELDIDFISDTIGKSGLSRSIIEISREEARAYNRSFERSSSPEKLGPSS